MLKILVRVVLGLLALVLVIVGAGVGYVWHLGNEVVKEAEATGWFEPPPSSAPMTTFETVIRNVSFNRPWDQRGPVCSLVAYTWGNITNGEAKWPGIAVDLANQISWAQEWSQQGTTGESHLRRASATCHLEGRFSDVQILRLYLRRARFDREYIGVEAASQAVFGKPANELDLEESIRLAALFEVRNFQNTPEKLAKRAAYIRGQLNTADPQ